MVIVRSLNGISFPFSVSGVCPYSDCAGPLPTWTVENQDDLDNIYCPHCGRRISVSSDGKTLRPYEVARAGL